MMLSWTEPLEVMFRDARYASSMKTTIRKVSKICVTCIVVSREWLKNKPKFSFKLRPFYVHFTIKSPKKLAIDRRTAHLSANSIAQCVHRYSRKAISDTLDAWSIMSRISLSALCWKKQVAPVMLPVMLAGCFSSFSATSFKICASKIYKVTFLALGKSEIFVACSRYYSTWKALPILLFFFFTFLCQLRIRAQSRCKTSVL